VAHHWLSFIRYGDRQERESASSHTICTHGHLLPGEEIQDLLQNLNRFIDSKPDLFSRENWSKIFTELVLFSENGRELRLDRLMVDENEGEILIVDYKSGDIYEEEQMARYVTTVRSLPFVARNGYRVRGEFIELSI